MRNSVQCATCPKRLEKPRGLPLEGGVAVILRSVHGVARDYNEIASKTQPFGGWCE